ncbi:hypothetical protein, partial [Mesorhizobium sp. M0060]|uniref:hypothetical protein n=1 Tax=Mesorhizobium sp. M0060 TaxID=2956866 RepID=UPI003338A05E
FLLIFFDHLVSTYFGGHLVHQSTQQQKVRGNSRLQTFCAQPNMIDAHGGKTRRAPQKQDAPGCRSPIFVR